MVSREISLRFALTHAKMNEREFQAHWKKNKDHRYRFNLLLSCKLIQPENGGGFSYAPDLIRDITDASSVVRSIPDYFKAHLGGEWRASKSHGGKTYIERVSSDKKTVCARTPVPPCPDTERPQACSAPTPSGPALTPSGPDLTPSGPAPTPHVLPAAFVELLSRPEALSFLTGLVDHRNAVVDLVQRQIANPPQQSVLCAASLKDFFFQYLPFRYEVYMQYLQNRPMAKRLTVLSGPGMYAMMHAHQVLELGSLFLKITAAPDSELEDKRGAMQRSWTTLCSSFNSCALLRTIRVFAEVLYPAIEGTTLTSRLEKLFRDLSGYFSPALVMFATCFEDVKFRRGFSGHCHEAVHHPDRPEDPFLTLGVCFILLAVLQLLSFTFGFTIGGTCTVPEPRQRFTFDVVGTNDRTPPAFATLVPLALNAILTLAPHDSARRARVGGP